MYSLLDSEASTGCGSVVDGSARMVANTLVAFAAEAASIQPYTSLAWAIMAVCTARVASRASAPVEAAARSSRALWNCGEKAG